MMGIIAACDSLVKTVPHLLDIQFHAGNPMKLQHTELPNKFAAAADHHLPRSPIVRPGATRNFEKLK